MNTEHIREKLNALTNLIAAESLQIFQHELLVEAAAATTGDKQVDSQMRTQAQNSKSVILASQRRLVVYKAKQAELQKELDASEPDKPQ